ncbi:CmcI family methyltransferase [Scytonema sp. NUACC26]|uniref:CmcI family methyltransferase n=1 Tax=Scytonema sp. NUACC26 TaxID=3140176 RepID=UPI0034DC6D1F
MNQHILLYSDDPGLGGVAHYNHTILCGLAALGYRLTCVQSKVPNPLIDEQKELGIQHIWIDFDTTQEPNRTVNDGSHAYQIFEDTQPDLIIFSDTWPLANSGVKEVAIERGIPYMIVVGFVAPYPGGLPTVFLDKILRIYQVAKAVIAVSQENLSLLHQLFGLPRDQGQVIYYGRPPKYFVTPQKLVRDRLRQELDIPSDAVVCFTSARLEPIKGYQYQLAAIERLKNTKIWNSLYFVWAGGGKLEAELKEALAQLNIVEKVKILGQRWDIPDWLDASDIFVLTSLSEGMPLAVMEAMAKGLPVIASAVSGVPEELGDTGKLLPDPKINPEATVNELVETIQAWCANPELRDSIAKACKTRAEQLFKEELMIAETHQVIESILVSSWDYISPEFELICPDSCFPNIIIGDTNNCFWQYLRREIPHNWYVDKRQPSVGFLNRDEAHILYNTALKFTGKKALEIGCWLGWSACHLALAGVELDVVDPLLSKQDFYESVSSSLEAADVLGSVNLVAGYSPQTVDELAAKLQRKWSLIFIDGNHDAPGPLYDAMVCEKYAEDDALILFHDLASPDVAQGLAYLEQHGWKVMIYQTMQIMGVAWRGNIEPVVHEPDPKVDWHLPKHLECYPVSKLVKEQVVNKIQTVQEVQAMMQQALNLLDRGKPIEAMQIAEQTTHLGVVVPDMHFVRSICLYAVQKYQQAFEAAKAELEINPNHSKAQEIVKNFTNNMFRQKPKVPTHQRSWNTSLPQETLLSVQEASHKYSYKGTQMIKNPFDFALYPLLLWNLQPRTIIEIGSNRGGSALWLGDMLNNFGIDGHIFSVDILKVTSVNHPRVTFMEGNGQALDEIFTPDFLESLPHPLLMIEDADHSYETSKYVLEFFHPYLKKGEYIVIEDGIISDLTQDISYNSGPHRALKEFLSKHGNEYEVDSNYCDFFGYNITWCTNGFLQKIQEQPMLQEVARGVNSQVKPSNFVQVNRSNCLNVGKVQSKPRVDVVLQATGIHGWSASHSWVNTLKREGLLNRVFHPIADWGVEEPEDDDGLFEYLKNPQADVMLLLGFDWHSQPLHNTLKWQEQWNKLPIKKIAVLQECYSAEVVQNTPAWKHLMYQALASTIPCVDALLCHHEPDVDFLQKQLEISLPIIFLPFGIDTQYFQNARPFSDRLNRAIFRGNAPRYFTKNTYEERQKLIEALSNSQNVDLFSTNLNGFKNPFEVVQEYVKELNSYRLLLNLPSISSTLTARPFEILACSGLLLQNKVIGEKSNKLFRDWEHLVYYDADNPEDLLNKINYLIAHPDVAEKIALSGYELCYQQHTIECRIQTLIEWANCNFQLPRDKPKPVNSLQESKSTHIHYPTYTAGTENIHQPIASPKFKVIVDGVFFQLYKTGIARVWKSLLQEWVKDGFAQYLTVLDRAGTAPRISGIHYVTVPAYNYANADADKEMLQQVCDAENANVFISSYYTTPITTPSIFLAHDMIPEIMGWNLEHPMWQEKHHGIKHSSAFIAVSENTARDLVKCFPDISLNSVTVAKNGVDRQIFSPSDLESINSFKSKYGISKPYFMIVGGGGGYKNSILFFKAFAQLVSKQGFEIVATGIGGLQQLDFRNYTSGTVVHMLQLSDEELAIAYSGAVALVYPSTYEGFGLPVLEAMACGCPVITCPNASLPEVVGEAAIYVNDNDVEELANALCEVQKYRIRETLIASGLQQAKEFSWSKMAKTVSAVLIDATLLPLKLKQTNLIMFPDWSQSEDLLNKELDRVIGAIATHLESKQTTLLIDTSGISYEDAELLLSGASLNLLMQRNIDVSEELTISLVGELSQIQWEALLSRIQRRIVLEPENTPIITHLKADNLPSLDWDSFIASKLVSPLV